MRETFDCSLTSSFIGFTRYSSNRRTYGLTDRMTDETHFYILGYKPPVSLCKPREHNVNRVNTGPANLVPWGILGGDKLITIHTRGVIM